MSTSHWMNEVTSVRQLRDELKLKANLLRADAKAELEKLEERWHELERQLEPVRGAVGESAKDIGASAKALLESLAQSYRRIRDAAKPAA